MKFLLDPKAKAGLAKFWRLQFEMAWNAAGADAGLVAGEVKAGTSHPDFGKGWEKLNPVTAEFISRLCVLRSFHFAELSASGELRKLVNIGTAREGRDPAFEGRVAKRFHDDWVRLRAVMYTAYDESTRLALISGGLKPFGDHEGDKEWEAETSAQQGNDLRLVPKLGWILGYCEESDDEELKAYFASL